MSEEDKIPEVVKSACCRCLTPILAQVVPEGMKFSLVNESTGNETKFNAIEWCQNCEEIHLMEDIPNPETRRLAKRKKIVRNICTYCGNDLDEKEHDEECPMTIDAPYKKEKPSCFNMAVNILKADLKILRAEKPRNEHNIERARIVLESLKYGQKLEEKLEAKK